ncbi:ABC transporter permease [Streptomyces sp. NPDC047315]|uniref:ABC transporter permease n=1 Tax=Streptomyces sp. NPDC047315 TaxID=3155142 RepID=UPI00340E6783
MTAFVGTGRLVRLVLRRDRWLMLAWMLWLVLISASLATTLQDQYPTAADRTEYVETSSTNPTFLALYGPLTDSGLGGIVAQRLGLVPIFVALVSVLTVIRHTRTEEQAGRRELLSAGVCGRHAPLAAAVSVTAVANLVVGFLVGAVVGQDLPGAGSLALGLGFAAVGCAFAAVGALAAQVTENAGTARGIGIGAMGAFLLIRIAADSSGEDSGLNWLNWLSPLGWRTEMGAFGANRWWVLLLFAVFTAGVLAVAMAVSARRDVGAGLLAARLGPPEAAPGLRGPFGLAWRLHRTLLAGWTAAFVLLGVVFGGLAEGVGDILKDNEQLQDVFARIGGQQGMVDSFIASMMSLVGLIAAGYGVQAVLRLRREEESSRGEYLLASGAGRLPWVASHLVFALVGPAVVLAVAGLSAGVVHGANVSDVGGRTASLLGAALVQLPAVWILTGLTLALFGLLPRVAAVAGWGALAVCFMLGQFGQALEFDQSLLDLSPFTHVPRVPGGDVTAGPLVWLLLIGALLTAAGLVRARQRDVGA